MTLSLIVHGGAGAIAPERYDHVRAGCADAVMAGWHILLAGGNSLDAVTAAVQSLENNPEFNAGTGAVLTSDGTIELDAGIMDGATLQVGAVAGLQHIKNPILLARHVLSGPYVLLANQGAERFAVEQGMALCEPDEMITAEMQARWQQLSQQQAATGLQDAASRHGTVGAVAIDAQGHIVAATSTGGTMMKMPGRIGDSPVVGSGFYAEDAIGGVACTGHGEDFLRLALARRTMEMLEHGSIAQSAAENSIAVLGERIQGEGGLIVVDFLGNVGFARNTSAMSYGYMRTGMSQPATGI